MRLKPIRQQVVVVFGASSGIGRESALRFAGRGARVVVAARSDEGLETLVDEIRRTGGEAVGVPADVTDFEQVRAVAETAILHAAENPTRQMVVGGSGHMMLMGQRISPRMMDSLYERIGFEGQKTDEPKSPAAPDNLYGPIGGYDQVEGNFRKQAAAMSVSRLLQNDGLPRLALAGAMIGAVALLARKYGAEDRGSGRFERRPSHDFPDPALEQPQPGFRTL